MFLTTMAFGVACFTLILISQRSGSQSTSPLILLLSCMLLLSSGTIVFELLPYFIQLYISMLPLLFFALLPALWFYHEALTAEKEWQWNIGMWKHFCLLPFAFILGVGLMLLPASDFNAMFFSQQDSTTLQIEILSGAFFFALLLWCLLSCVYVIMLIKRTIVYRQRLKNVYSSQEGRDLKWLIFVSLLIVITWIYAVIVLAAGDELAVFGISENGVLLLLTVIVWLISANGLRQRPGFEYTIVTEAVSLKDEKKTYQHSALTSESLLKIANKLSVAINEENVHLDADLTLAKLSVAVCEPSQYISQTLSQQLCTTFYDFINQARIEDAKKMLTANVKSITDIALATGFNSRSSFYKAFKQFTHMTPSQFRNT